MHACPICGAAHATCGGPTMSTPIDGEETVVVSMPRKGTVRTDPPDMVRVQLKENDIRSYRRADVEEALKSTPGAFILGQGPDDAGEHEAAPPDPSTARGRRSTASSAPNKSRTTKPAEPKTPPAETGSEPPSSTPPATDPPGQAGTKGEAGAGATDA